MKKQRSVLKKSGAITLVATAFATAALGATSPAGGQGLGVFGGGSTGGGDALALEFKAAAEVALQNLQSQKSTAFSGVNLAQLQNKIESAQILVSDGALAVAQDGIIQDSAAENIPSRNLIILNRAGYSKIGIPAIQQALALHEFLSLMGVESTGNYPISGQYLLAYSGGLLSAASADESCADYVKQAVEAQARADLKINNFTVIVPPMGEVGNGGLSGLIDVSVVTSTQRTPIAVYSVYVGETCQIMGLQKE
ncbi:MAG: hypothetical protein P4M08_11865 [Oligoflexia bacterium]|nr:hypothetical protein [Oligoflexia bacterium]